MALRNMVLVTGGKGDAVEGGKVGHSEDLSSPDAFRMDAVRGTTVP